MALQCARVHKGTYNISTVLTFHVMGGTKSLKKALSGGEVGGSDHGRKKKRTEEHC